MAQEYQMIASSKIKELSRIAQFILMNCLPRIQLRKKTESLNILFLVPLYHTNMLAMVESLKRANHSIGVIAAKEENIENYELLSPLFLKKIIESEQSLEALPFKLPDLIFLRDHHPSMIEIANKLAGPQTKLYHYNQKPLRRKRGIRNLIKDLKRLRAHQIKGVPLHGFSPVDHHESINNRWPKKLLTRTFNFPVFEYPCADSIPLTPLKRIQVLMVGKLAQPRKRHFWFIDALKSSGIQVHLKICGSGLDLEFDDGTRSREYYFELKKCAESTDDSDPLLITLHEDINFYELSKYYSEAQIFALPSVQEEFGISVLEAMTHSCAVIVSDECGSARHITDGVDGLVFPSADYIAFEKKVHRLLQDSALRISIQNQAKRTTTKKHNYSQFAEFIESLANQ